MNTSMTPLVYVDTNIYLDFILGRRGESGRNLDEEAFTFFNRAMHCEFSILASTKVKTELFANAPLDKLRMLFAFLKKKLIFAEPTPDEEQRAAQLDPINKGDALHAILANTHGATYLITQNMKDFKKFSNLVESRYPADI